MRHPQIHGGDLTLAERTKVDCLCITSAVRIADHATPLALVAPMRALCEHQAVEEPTQGAFVVAEPGEKAHVLVRHAVQAMCNLDAASKQLSAVGRGGIEPPTRRFSVCCSTD